MGRRMTRGKQQLLLNYLPGRTFDFQKIGTIARVSKVRGIPRVDLNLGLILRSVADQASAWPEEHRPGFRDLERSAERFVLIEPKGAEAEMFPLVFWCQYAACGAIVQGRSVIPNSAVCTRCKRGKLVQLRFVKVHRCGALEALEAPRCSACASLMCLDTRQSERISSFQWVCRVCAKTVAVFAGRCRSCNWPGEDAQLKNMSVEVHRAGRTFYPHSTVLLNQPGRELGAFLAVPQWPSIAASVFLGIEAVRGKRLLDFGHETAPSSTGPTMSPEERERLRSRFGEQMVAQFELMQAQLESSRAETRQSNSAADIERTLARLTGVPTDVWNRAGQEMLEAVMPLQSGRVRQLSGASDRLAAASAAQLGIESITTVGDFPITTATFGFSRADYQPGACRLNAFPADADHGGKFPIFVDVVQADAILMRLDHRVVLQWMRANGLQPTLPSGEDPSLVERAYFVRLLDGVALRHTLGADQAEARCVFGLLHSLSHLSVRRASLLSGLDATSLSEYVLPRALTWAIYCNHRFGATIGALTALFEQSLSQWLNDIRASRRCVYDPVCSGAGGCCHACSHVAETSCRFFNLNLSRSFLFGGHDVVLGEIHVGFVDFVAGLLATCANASEHGPSNREGQSPTCT